MKKLLLVLTLVVAAGCAKDRSLEATVKAIDGIDGRDGRDGVSCTVEQQEGGAAIYCSDETYVFIANGRDGRDGQNGTDGSNGEDGSNGSDGAAGTSCSVSQTETGALITCGDTSAVIANGQDGQNGSDGQDGSDGEDGEDGQNGASSATIANYSSSSCVQLSGVSPARYTKPTGSSNRGIYTSSSCSSSSKESEVSQGEAYWVSSNSLATLNNGALRVITFN